MEIIDLHSTDSIYYPSSYDTYLDLRRFWEGVARDLPLCRNKCSVFAVKSLWFDWKFINSNTDVRDDICYVNSGFGPIQVIILHCLSDSPLVKLDFL